jgi:uncharacterized SAM-binding protein YcdF (DUF218 family)
MPSAATRSRRRLAVGACAFLVLVSILAWLSIAHLGHWLVVSDALAEADAIVVLRGSPQYRAKEAGRLYLDGYAPQVWLPRTAASNSSALTDLGIPEPPDYDRLVLEHLGVPAAAIHLVGLESRNTAEEILSIRSQLDRVGAEKVIIVTSPFHTRRVRATWRKLVSEPYQLTVRPAPDDPFDPDRWWRSTDDTFDVVREVLGLINLGTGLPVQPRE